MKKILIKTGASLLHPENVGKKTVMNLQNYQTTQKYNLQHNKTRISKNIVLKMLVLFRKRRLGTNFKISKVWTKSSKTRKTKVIRNENVPIPLHRW